MWLLQVRVQLRVVCGYSAATACVVAPVTGMNRVWEHGALFLGYDKKKLGNLDISVNEI